MFHHFAARRAARRTYLAAALALSALALFAAACGDDDDAPKPASATASTAASPTAAAFPVTVTDSAGTSVTITAAPQRVISFSPGATEVLYAVGAGGQVAAVDRFSDYPAETASKPKLEYSKPAPEPALALKPDLVIMATRQEGQVEQFRALGMKVVLLREPANLDGVAAQVRLIGKVTGHDAEGSKLADSMEKRIAAVKAKVAKVTQGPKVFYEITPDGFTAGPDTFIGSMLATVKAQNIAASATTAFPQLSVEVIIASNPEVILLTDGGDSGGQSLDTVKARPGWGNVAAVKNGKVFVVDSNQFTRPGPRVVDALEQLTKLLYPDLA